MTGCCEGGKETVEGRQRDGSCVDVNFFGSVSGLSISMTEVNKLFLLRATEGQLGKSCWISFFKHCPIITSWGGVCKAYLIQTAAIIHRQSQVYSVGDGAGWGLVLKSQPGVVHVSFGDFEGTFEM